MYSVRTNKKLEVGDIVKLPPFNMCEIMAEWPDKKGFSVKALDGPYAKAYGLIGYSGLILHKTDNDLEYWWD